MEKKIIVPLDFWFPSNPSTSVTKIENEKREMVSAYASSSNYLRISSGSFNYNPYLEEQKTMKLINDNDLVNFIKNNKINIFQICGCSDDEIYTIIKKREEILNNSNTPKDHKELLNSLIKLNDPNYKYYEQFKNNDYYKDSYALKDYKDLSDRAKELVGSCEHFLFYKYENETDIRIKSPSFWDFVKNFLNLNDGYDYILMNIIENYGICEHGSGIRCAWYGGECEFVLDDLSEESYKKIEDFIESDSKIEND